MTRPPKRYADNCLRRGAQNRCRRNGLSAMVTAMTATADPPTTLTPATISRLRVPDIDELSRPAVKGFFAKQQRDEGLTSNWFRALSLNEGDQIGRAWCRERGEIS